MRVLIIEDELPAAKRLKKLIEGIGGEYEILTVLESIEQANEWFLNNDQPDLIFSDIQLADGVSFEIFQTNHVEAPIIFTTAYDEYAIKAFEHNSIGYLLKPFSSEDLEQALSKVAHQEVSTDAQLAELLKAVGSKKEYKSRFLIPKADGYIPLGSKDIAYFFTEDKMVKLVTHDRKRLIINQRLDELEKQLDPSEFFRINRQYIASFDSIEKVTNHFNGKLKVYLKPETEDEVMISRLKATEFKEWLGS